MQPHGLSTGAPSRPGRVGAWTIVGVVVIAGIAVAVATAVIWHCLGQADQVARRSDLLMLAVVLNEHAKREGSYGIGLAEAVREAGLLNRVDPQDIVYVAFAKPYNPQANQMLFYERSPRRYGFDRGSYAVYQDYAAVYRRAPPAPSARVPAN